MSKLLNDTVSKCADLLKTLTKNEAQIISQQIMSMFGYNTDPYPDEPNIRCPNCDFCFTGDVIWDNLEGEQGTNCPACRGDIILDQYWEQNGIEMNVKGN